MDVHSDLKEFIELLNKNNAEYLIVGGYASSYHSRPRYTKDIDIWINPTKTNAKKVKKTLDDFGFAGIDVSVKDLITPGIFIQLGYEPVRIDLITSLVGLKFKNAFKNRIQIKLGTLKKINFISAEDLIINKTKSGREKDLQDVRWINKYLQKKRNR